MAALSVTLRGALVQRSCVFLQRLGEYLLVGLWRWHLLDESIDLGSQFKLSGVNKKLLCCSPVANDDRSCVYQCRFARLELELSRLQLTRDCFGTLTHVR